jgi:rare lipoprotein A
MNGINKKAQHLALALAVSFTALAGAPKAFAASSVEPEVESTAWEENEQECASVTLNGKEILTFRGESAKGSAEDRAEELADKLQDLLKEEKTDISKLLPGVDGSQASLRLDGNTIAKFDCPVNSDIAPMEYSFKIVNSIRTILGASALPQTFLKHAETQSPEQAYTACLGKTSTPNNFVADFSGHASWYGGRFHGRRTSNGDTFDQQGFTAAHRSLPFGTKLLVFNRRTGNSCVVEVNDRGPFIENRVIDLSRGAAEKLNMLSSGVAMVDCMVINNDNR